ncbi:10964_t:CDS:2, partial [Gigaspora rosea]
MSVIYTAKTLKEPKKNGSINASTIDEAKYKQLLPVKKCQLVCTQAKHLIHQEKMAILTPAPIAIPQTVRQGRRMTRCSFLLESYLPNIKFLFPDHPHQGLREVFANTSHRSSCRQA